MTTSLLRIRLFVAVYEERSITTAAIRECSSQSGVSQHLQKLEEQLGVRLFYRESTGVVPTPAADAYYAACQQVLRALFDASRVARAHAGGIEGELAVGLTPTVAAALIAPTLAAFMAAHPNVILRVVEQRSTTIVEQIAAGELDFAIVPVGTDLLGVHSTLFIRTPEFLVTGPVTDDPAFTPVQLSEVGALKLIVPSNLNSRRRHLEQYLTAANARIERKLEIDTMLGTLHLVETTDWVTIFPGIMMAQDLRRAKLHVRPLVNPPLMLDIFEIHQNRKPLTVAALAFLEELRTQADRLSVTIDNAIRAAAVRRT